VRVTGLPERLRTKLAGWLRRARVWLGLPVPGRPADSKYRRRLGQRAEKDAARFLKGKGYTILQRNFRLTDGEIDLVAFKDGVVAFVEVRSRTEPTDLDPLETVTHAKRQRIVRAAHHYAAFHSLSREDVTLRFDVAAVRYGPDGRLAEVQHVEDAFSG